MTTSELYKVQSALKAFCSLCFMDNEKALKTLRDRFCFSDDMIRELGLGYLLPEPEETPLKEYSFIYTESRSLCVTIKAHTENEAWDFIEDYAFDDPELTSNDDGEWTLLN